MEPTPFGQELKRLRTARGLSQAQLAAALDANQSLVGGLESGHVAGVSAQMLFRLTAALGLKSADHWKDFLPPDLPGRRAGQGRPKRTDPAPDAELSVPAPEPASKSVPRGKRK